MNYNFVTTEPIFKIPNSAKSYCLAESQYPSPIFLNLPFFYHPPPPRAQNLIVLGTYVYVMNYNFVTTELIFKIQNSAESYCLAESENYWYGHGHTLPYLLCSPDLNH